LSGLLQECDNLRGDFAPQDYLSGILTL